MNESPKVDVFAAGRNVVDVFVRVPEQFALGEKHEVSEMLVQGGGPAATAACVLKLMSTTIQTPEPLSNLMGAYDSAHWLTEVREIKSGIGVLARGTALAEGTALDAGKLVLLTAGTEAAAYGVLLDPEIDTTVAHSDGSVTGSVARAGSFKGGKLIVPAGINAATLTTRLREIGIFLEGAIIVPA